MRHANITWESARAERIQLYEQSIVLQAMQTTWEV